MNSKIRTALVASLATLQSIANTSEPVQSVYSEKSLKELTPKKRTWLFIGGNLGLAMIKPGDTLRNHPNIPDVREDDLNTFNLDIKGLGSFYTDNWVFDLGGGYLFNKGSTSPSFTGLDKINVETRAGFAEFSPRYRLSEAWQLGLVANALFGTDVSFDENRDPDVVGGTFTILGGLRANWESQGEDSRWRLGGEFKKSFNISERNVWFAQLDVQYGWPIGGDEEVKPIVTPVVETTPVPEPSPEPTPVPTQIEAPKFAEVVGTESIKIYLGEAVLRFKTNKADLKPASHKILGDVTSLLNAAPNAWANVRVEGHTDERGKLAYNDRLSERRAMSVARKMMALGIPRAKMKVKGFGPRTPIDPAHNERAWALNRRVEVWLDGVKDPETMIKDLNGIRTNFETGSSQ